MKVVDKFEVVMATTLVFMMVMGAVSWYSITHRDEQCEITVQLEDISDWGVGDPE